jgi:excisionase family DNA binding protein
MGLISTEMAAARLGITRRRVRAMIGAEILPAEKIGRDWLIEETDVEKLRRQERKPGRPRKKKP